MDNQTEKEPEFAVGDKITVRKSTDVPVSFKGTVSKVYTNSAMVTIEDFDPSERTVVEDLKYRTIVNFKHLRKSGKSKKSTTPKDTDKK
ncbi:MAG: hypothetical protein LKF36_13075 [Lactobacillus sp.]|jgi:hypothetical protein|nr:hypothetical protein [Lactobacillus sp.]